MRRTNDPHSQQYPFSLRFASALLEASPLVVTHVVSEWVHRSVSLRPPYHVMRQILAVMMEQADDTSALLSKCVTLDGLWDLERAPGGRELRLKRKSSSPGDGFVETKGVLSGVSRCVSRKCLAATVNLTHSRGMDVQLCELSSSSTEQELDASRKFVVNMALPVAKESTAIELELRPVDMARDWFHPPWRASPLRLKDFLRSQGVPLGERSGILVIAPTTSPGATSESVIRRVDALAVLIRPERVLVSQVPSSACGDGIRVVVRLKIQEI